MPDTTLLTPEVAQVIFSTIFAFVKDQFSGLAIILGAILGLIIAAALINNATHGELSVRYNRAKFAYGRKYKGWSDL